MIYQYSSIKEVIGNVIRNTRLQDTSYILDLPEWIGQAMSFMRTKMETVYMYKDITQNFHLGSLPCGLISVECVEYKGYRMKYAGGRTNASKSDYSQSLKFTEWSNLPECNDTYYTEMGYLKTPSLCDGTIRLHYKSIPVDDEGFPLVPDNANYKQALYWHCRAMMIGTGYEDPAFKYDFCDQQYEKYAARAIAGINYPSVDIMHSRIQDITRFLPDNFVSYFGLGTTCSSTVSGFIAQMPKSFTESFVERISTTEIITTNSTNFVYTATGSEGYSVVLNELKEKYILELFLDNYLLNEEKNIGTALTPNTFRFDRNTGIITVFNTFSPDQIIQGLRTI